jgi:PAS domain S-box-containing protein
MFKRYNEGYLKRQKQNQELLVYINKYTVISVPIVVAVLIFYPLLQIGLTERYSFLAFVISYTALIQYVIIKIYQVRKMPILPLFVEALSFSLLHISGGVGIVFILGFQHPVSIFWLMVIVIGYINFGRLGHVITGLLFAFMAVIDFIVYGNNETAYMLSSFSLFIAIFISSLSVTKLLDLTVMKNEALSKSRKEERAQRDSLSTVINNLSDAVIATDTKGIIRVFNASVINLLDTNQNLMSKNIDSILHLTDQDDKPVSISSMLKKATRVVTEDSLTMDISDEQVRLEITYSPIRNTHQDGETLNQEGYVIILRDVTKAKSLEEERDEFISVVSHELRTPIAITEGAIDNARLIFEKGTSKKDVIKKTLSMAHDQIVFLAKMINDLSTLSRAERGVADEAESIDVTELVHALYDEYTPQAKEKGLILNLSTHGKLDTVKASRLYLQELLQNFITNSIKYTKEGHIDIVAERKKDVISFSIVDTGIGISKADQEKVFQKFYRSEDYRTRETGGTGLGLYVAQKLAHKLDTQINVESRLNHGSTFSFEMKAEKTKSSKR